ncbi:MAG: lysophospholipid acyltransferase family protein [Deltaproteobacteria bacterium]|nr:lysophospholipid acyltransferase family protein [Deltaproteobacteria bacterium]RLB93877.1 MAG: lauroyl acyltransferase [Deltaproteobacteria bacterium]
MESQTEKLFYMIINTFFSWLGNFSLTAGQRIGSLLGLLLFICDSKHRNIAIDNLTHAFGREKGPEEIRDLAQRVFRNLGCILFEIAWSLKLSERDFPRYFDIKGLSNLKKAYEKGKGVLVLTGHVGNWELLTIVAGMTGYPLSIVVRPLDFSPLNEFFVRVRSRFGARLIPKQHSMRAVLRSLKRGEMVAVLLDQNVDWYDGVFVDFFGRPACSNKGLALLALHTGAPVVPVFLVRDRLCLKAEFGPEMRLIQTGDETKDIEANTQQYTKAIESVIRRHPDQWFWVHQRWKTRPYQPWPRKK